MKKLMPVLTVCSVLLMAAAIVYSTFGSITTQKVPGGTVIALDGTWSESASQEADRLFATYSSHIPDGADFADGYLYMQSYWTEFEVQSEGRVVFSHFSDAADGYVHLLSLGRLNAGQELTVTFSVKSSANLATLHKSSFYIGDQSGIYSSIMSSSLYALVFFMLAMFLGVMVLISAFLLKNAPSESGHSSGIIALGVFTLTAGIWVLTDSKLLLLVTDRAATVALVSMLSFFIMPVFLLRFTKQMINIAPRVYYAVVLIYLAILNSYAVSYMLKAPFSTVFLVLEHMMSAVTMLLIFYYGIQDMRRTKDIKIRRILIGYIFFFLGSAAALVMFYIVPFSGYSQTYALGTTVFILFLFDAACREVYERLEHNANIEFQAKLAYMDVMTGIGNRTAFHEQQQKDKNTRGRIAYIMADVNNLKTANDTLGHAAGDRLIISAARCLSAAVGSMGDCYRIGGDEFVARITDASEQELNACLERFRSLVEQNNAGASPALSVAVGCAWTDAAVKDLDLLLGSADAEMYKEKQRIKGAAVN